MEINVIILEKIFKLWTLGRKISEVRKLKGYTQEELAESSKINLRTIQRIENGKNEPRGKTLNLICDVLEIDINEFKKTKTASNNRNIIDIIINLVFYILLNLILMFMIGYLTLDSDANFNSRIGAFMLSFFVPIFIVFLTPLMSKKERILKFGLGYFSYIIMLLFIQGFKQGFEIGIRTVLFISLIIAIGVLYYGNAFIKTDK